MTNKELITKFYSAFSRLDHAEMNSCYDDNIIFNDPVFGVLRGEEARAMWRMLCRNAKDFSLTFSDIELLDEEYATCKWTASYTFSKTGRRVVNHIKAYMKIKDGRIIEHSDAFRLSTWLAQAFGWKGVLFGWTGVMKRAARKEAAKSLRRFMEKELDN